MAQRSIGQERFGFSGSGRTTSSLDALVSLIDWHTVAVLLDPLYPASKGEPAWPPLAMFRALLLSIWYDLSDVKLAEALLKLPTCFISQQAGLSKAHAGILSKGGRHVLAIIDKVHAPGFGAFGRHKKIEPLCIEQFVSFRSGLRGANLRIGEHSFPIPRF